MIVCTWEKAGGRASDLAHRFRRAYKLRRSPRGYPSPRVLCRFVAASSAASSPLPRPATDAPPSSHHATAPPWIFGLQGVHERPSGVYYTEIRSGDVRLGLGTFETAHEAAHAYDAAAWRLGRPRAQMNFHDIYTHEQAHVVAPLPCLITNKDCEDHRWRQRRLLIAEEDERAMAEWRRRHPEDVATENAFWADGRAMAEWRRHHPEDVAAENAFWEEKTARRRPEREDRRRRKTLAISQYDLVNAGGKLFFGSDDERWDDIWLDISGTVDDDDEDDSE
ncbi:Protein TRANSPARENT TESTA 12 [Hordeum vulgare]|nr:Protein TRANSPARENT TESTA 12 [Hordeum vulgare]